MVLLWCRNLSHVRVVGFSTKLWSAHNEFSTYHTRVCSKAAKTQQRRVSSLFFFGSALYFLRCVHFFGEFVQLDGEVRKKKRFCDEIFSEFSKVRGSWAAQQHDHRNGGEIQHTKIFNSRRPYDDASEELWKGTETREGIFLKNMRS